MSLTRSLARFAAGPITPGVAAQVTQISALDWLAVGRAGAGEPVARILRDMAQGEGGAAAAAVFATRERFPARMAALVNGATSHALDYDDTHFAHIGHPSVAVFPAALAMAERGDHPLADMLEAALVGMELSIRIGVWLGRSHYQAGFHQTATAGAFGAAAAAARLIGLDAGALAHVLGLTATRAAGLKAQFGTMGKPYNAGLAAAAGVECALLVKGGLSANPDALEGMQGFGQTHHGENNLGAALDGLGEDWLFEDVSHKFHACCHGLHAALEAARDLDLAAPEIAELTVQTHPRWMSVCNQARPDSGLGAKFSFATVLAMRALGYDTARLDTFSDAVCADPRLIALRDQVQVVENPQLKETEAILQVLRRDGARRQARHDLLAPMPLADRVSRVRDKAAKLIGADQADAAWALLRGGGPVSEFARAVARARD